jgi:hypothetical protein
MSSTRWSAHLKREALINGVTNALANGGIGWLLFKDKTVINAWQGASTFGVENFSALEYSLFKGAWTGFWAAPLTRQIIKGCAAGMINEQRIEELDRS